MLTTPGPGAQSVVEFEQIARARLPGEVWDFVAGGSGAETTLAANRAALDRVALVPRAMGDLSGRHTGTDLFGVRAVMPAAIAPIAYQRLVHPDGELALARAAKRAGIPFTVSTMSSTPLEQVAEVGGTTWFQLYPLRDREQSRDLVRRAEAAGCSALMVTVDVPWMARRLRDVRNEFTVPAHVSAANFTDSSAAAGARQAVVGDSAVAAHTAATFAAFTWPDLTELRRAASIPLIVKGILDPRDAAKAISLGADAVVVSNHGGRQLDGAIASADAVTAVREAVGDRGTVLFDSGIRSGLDIMRALTLGADAVLIGRPALWGLAADGEAGADRVLGLFHQEFAEALGLAGCPDPAAARTLTIWRGSV
ncbi:alpha-hydroxy-acid oxidizing protein [Catenulispora sp. NF23]|uniref:alpha-hydroxy acid oxidase n=1 Tax=Catenulispora pinistramenti TaxID=2705254 RepID=UPI001BAC9F30|nr:alpha-hydroxy acid oxidase [Catenulispora pinistramenti]MBS2533745.1 alpha-hydroxy-acid oxidizing protein [Catenulispora pinistramenti]